MRRTLLALALTGLPLAAAPAQDAPRVRPLTWAQPVIDTDLDNCHRVDDHYRRVVQGWTFDEAWDEMVHGGCGHHSVYTEKMRWALLSLDVPAMRERLEVELD